METFTCALTWYKLYYMTDGLKENQSENTQKTTICHNPSLFSPQQSPSDYSNTLFNPERRARNDSRRIILRRGEQDVPCD
ncbi:hypothetical protein AKJ16_DCAP19277 [Drosera capensis]